MKLIGDTIKLALPPATTWQSQSFTASGTFVVPLTYPLLPNGKVEIYVTATAGGGPGGTGAPGSGVTGQGGLAGQWCRRYRLELTPGDRITVTVGAATSSGSNGSTTTIALGAQTLLTLTGGTKGTNASDGAGTPSPGVYNGTSFTVVSGSNANDNAIRGGARGGPPATNDQTGTSGGIRGSYAGDANGVMGQNPAGAGQLYEQNIKGGGGGGGLFGAGGDGAVNTTGGAAAANSGGGGAGGGANGNLGGNGAAGRVDFEWKSAA